VDGPARRQLDHARPGAGQQCREQPLFRAADECRRRGQQVHTLPDGQRRALRAHVEQRAGHRDDRREDQAPGDQAAPQRAGAGGRISEPDAPVGEIGDALAHRPRKQQRHDEQIAGAGTGEHRGRDRVAQTRQAEQQPAQQVPPDLGPPWIRRRGCRRRPPARPLVQVVGQSEDIRIAVPRGAFVVEPVGFEAGDDLQRVDRREPQLLGAREQRLEVLETVSFVVAVAAALAAVAAGQPAQPRRERGAPGAHADLVVVAAPGKRSRTRSS
jgi:hypothetical protein